MNKKSIFLSLCVIIVLAVVAMFIFFINKESQETVSPASFLTYENEDLGFSFDYPTDWIVSENGTGEDMVIAVNSPKVIEMKAAGTIHPSYADHLLIYFVPTVEEFYLEAPCLAWK